LPPVPLYVGVVPVGVPPEKPPVGEGTELLVEGDGAGAVTGAGSADLRSSRCLAKSSMLIIPELGIGALEGTGAVA
jgi:hypothetical protein